MTQHRTTTSSISNTSSSHRARATARPLRPSLPPLPRKKHIHSPRKRRPLGPVGIALTIFGVLLLISCGGLSALYSLYKNTISTSFSSFIRPVGDNGEPAYQQSYSSIQGRSWNFLLLGSDNDAKFTFPALLTQVMMVVHIDTANYRAHMISIPRDTWVPIPQVGGMHKVSQAFYFGAQRTSSFEGGVNLARQTIETGYGIKIDRYAWIGLDGFADVIDTLGGVDVDIIHPIVDDTYPDDTTPGNDPYAYKRLHLAPGPQHLNGSQALEYIRSRHSDLRGDIGRTERQQQILEALKPKLNNRNILDKIPHLLNNLKGKLYTDLNQQELLAFAHFGRHLQADAIQHTTLGPGQGNEDYGHLATVYDPTLQADQSVIIPHCSTIQTRLLQILGPWNVHGCRLLTPPQI